MDQIDQHPFGTLNNRASLQRIFHFTQGTAQTKSSVFGNINDIISIFYNVVNIPAVNLSKTVPAYIKK